MKTISALFLPALLLSLLLPGTARADCANPTASAGEVVFNKNYCVMQFCNGIDWIPTGKSDPTACNSTCSSPGLVAHWKFDESSGNSTAVDSVGSNHGTLTSMDPATDWVAGKVGNALDFDGVNDRVSIPDNSSINITGNQITISAWIFWRGGDGTLIEKIDDFSGKNRGYLVRRWSSDGAEWKCFLGKDSWSSAAVNLPTNQWVHYACGYDGSNIRIYVNGVDSGVLTPMTGSLLTTTGQSLEIGMENATGSGREFNGKIDDVRIYNRALTAGEVASLHNSGAGCP